MRNASASDPAAAFTTRYEVAWSMPQTKLGQVASNSWWLDSTHHSEQSACARVTEIEKVVSGKQGSATAFKVHYNGQNIVSERVIARVGNATPPSRSAVLAPNDELKAVFAELANASSLRRSRNKSSSPRRTAIVLIVSAGFALFVGLVAMRASPTERPVPDRNVIAQKNEGALLRKQAGQIIVPRRNSELCDRYIFDNNNGAIKSGSTVPCNKTEDVNIVDQVNSFSSSWRRR
jgi:hypothetical protein